MILIGSPPSEVWYGSIDILIFLRPLSFSSACSFPLSVFISESDSSLLKNSSSIVLLSSRKTFDGNYLM